ncbi:MAG: HAD-IA family hydrolase [Bacteroidetes bacterium]|nr:HAD-IA family hydrolase [Bacteroidota bacterium]
MNEKMQISGLIWDLGGLFIQVHPERLPKGIWAQGSDFEKTHHLFECGLCSEFEFEQALQQSLTQAKTTTQAGSTIDFWNSLLGRWNLEDLEQLQGYRDQFTMVLLSNTNAWHETAFKQSLQEAGGQPLETYFDRVVFSHQHQMRKPQPEFYQKAVMGLGSPIGEAIPNESWLFVDDSQENLQGAATLGIQTYLHPRNTSPLKTLRRYLEHQAFSL